MTESIEVRRYQKVDIIRSSLDPIEDLLNLISVLRSVGYVRDMLRDIHGLVDATERTRVAKQISLHVQIALELSQQALESRPETSFLSLYYSCLDLAKIYLLFSGRRLQLERNRWHGATYDDRQMRRSFLNELVQIKTGGTIPLIYSTMFGKTIRAPLPVSLQEIYGSISAIGAEFGAIAESPSNLFWHGAELVQDDVAGHYLQVHATFDWPSGKRGPMPKELQAYPDMRLVSKKGEHPRYMSQRVKGPFHIVSEALIARVNRNAISNSLTENHNWILHCPLSSKPHVFNEEIYIMLAYFHLSNVVRYNPAHLYKLMDTKYWAILLSLRKHGYLSFLKAMWGHYQKSTFDIV